MSNDSPILKPEEHVLSTLEADGSRRWLTPKLAKGRLWHRRRVVAYVLLAIYSGLPWLQIAGEPAILIDLPGRELTLFGLSFLATDTVFLALALLTGFLAVFFLTALLGRVWCGWACPQTVYMEFVIRPIERLFLGTAGKGGRPRKEVAGWRRAAMYAAFFAISVHLAQTFMAYFVGAQNVRDWIWGSPAAHPAEFAIVAALTALMMIDFAYWREQLCIIGCPYGRLQSVLLDRDSKIVAYDAQRGEPRAPLRKSDGGGFENRGSCVDCSMCVQVCPTGIDIRDGLQLECVNCAQCIDACDEIMDRTGQPRGLVRYSSEAALDGQGQRFLRPRVVVYGSLISGLSLLLLTLVAQKPSADVTVLRTFGRPFVFVEETGQVQNTMRLKVTNRTDARRTYFVAVESPE
ncbi:MAG: cytochrome c oxidase accessory protein CcoG, partial [Planctomycetota bacterium]